VVATAAGSHTVLAGARSLPGVRRANARVDSELRFYAAFYVAYGLLALRVAPRAEREIGAVRALAGTMALAGLARAAGWRKGVRSPLVQGAQSPSGRSCRAYHVQC